MAHPGADVGCALRFDVAERATLALQVAVAASVRASSEELVVELDGAGVEVTEVALEHGTRSHLLTCGPGELTVRYDASVAPGEPAPAPVTDAERLTYVRQSRYCPSDRLESIIERELPDLMTAADPGAMAARWVSERLTYELGSSRGQDDALDTLLAGRGVCRDFAHLTVALCRAATVPARLVAVYAPGLVPMDFHAVAEVGGAAGWQVVDATRLAPRPLLCRIATGRDAADTAFAVTLDGSAVLLEASVHAVGAEFELDDHAAPVALA